MNTRNRIAATITGTGAVLAVLAATPSIAAPGPTGATQPTQATKANQQNAQAERPTAQRKRGRCIDQELPPGRPLEG